MEGALPGYSLSSTTAIISDRGPDKMVVIIKYHFNQAQEGLLDCPFTVLTTSNQIKNFVNVSKKIGLTG